MSILWILLMVPGMPILLLIEKWPALHKWLGLHESPTAAFLAPIISIIEWIFILTISVIYSWLILLVFSLLVLAGYFYLDVKQ